MTKTKYFEVKKEGINKQHTSHMFEWFWVNSHGSNRFSSMVFLRTFILAYILAHDWHKRNRFELIAADFFITDIGLLVGICYEKIKGPFLIIFIPFQVDIDENTLGEQTLPNFYAEDTNNCMNRERRREALAKFLRIIKADIDRETKGMGGVENLAKALQETPKFGGEESQQDVQEKLQHMRSMLTFLEASR